jgi:hypothetical protein
MDFRQLNIVTKKDPYLLPFSEEVLDEMAVMKFNNFWMDFFGYHQIMIPMKIGTRLHSSPIG